jgi:hypothetical protein
VSAAGRSATVVQLLGSGMVVPGDKGAAPHNKP